MKKLLKTIKDGWKGLRTADKIGIVIDILCGCGAAFVSKKVGDNLCEGHGRFERLCIRTVTTGASLAAAEAGAESLKRNYGDVAGLMIDAATGKAKLSSVDINKDGIRFEGEYPDE